MVSAAQVAEFRQANRDLVSLAQSDLTDFWSALNLNGNPIVVRDNLLEFFPELIQDYGNTAAVLGADFYDAIRDAPPSAASFRAGMASVPDVDQAQSVARWGLGPLFTLNDPAQSLLDLLGATQRLVLQAGRSTIIDAATSDPVRTGFARIPAGPTCRFCTMVASRGFVYATARSAGQSNEWHNDCDCVVIAGTSKRDLPEGYDLTALSRAYAAGEGTT